MAPQPKSSPPPSEDPALRMIEALEGQTQALNNAAEAMDNLAEHLGDLHELGEGLAKKASIGGILGSAFGRSKKQG